MKIANNRNGLGAKLGRVLSGRNSNWRPQVLLPILLLVAAVGVYTVARSSAAGAPDLVVTAITYSPSVPTAGQNVTFSATIKNQGTDVTPAGTVVGVQFSVDGVAQTMSTNYSQSIPAGGTVTLTANTGTSGTATWPASTGPHSIEAFVDYNNLISNELNEGNNKLTANLTIGNTGQIYLSPTTQTALVNQPVSVNVRITPGTSVEGVQATVSYDATKLQFVSIDATGSPFDQALGAQTGGNGTVSLTRGTLNGSITTDSFIAKINFTTLAGSGSTTPSVTGNAAHQGVYTNPSGGNATITLQTPDTTPPTATIASPAADTTVAWTQTITATAADNVGVTKVEFYIDGQLKSTDTASPYTYTLDTTLLSNGLHFLQVKAYDAAGNSGTSFQQNFTVKNLAEDINQDGKVDLLDFSLLASKFGQTGSTIGRSDINGDGTVNLLDFSLLAAKFGQ
jgi:hypothetical protein